MANANSTSPRTSKEKVTPAEPAPAQAIDIDAIAATVQDIGITFETVRDLYEIMAKMVVHESDNRKVTSLFVAVDRYMDDLQSSHEQLVGLIETMRASTKGGVQ